MIITRAPLRITLGGGGTDLASYYRERDGFIFALALDKYIYTSLQRPAFDPGVSLQGAEPERTDRAGALRHDLVRVALEASGIEDRFEASTIADIAGGTGLGSSSTFLVGLLAGLDALQGRRRDRQALAEEACRLEIEVLGRGIGKQDQYMAAFGGLTTLEIDRVGRVRVEAVPLAPEVRQAFIDHTHIYYTGQRRAAAAILDDQNRAMLAPAGQDRARAEDALSEIKALGRRILDCWRTGDLEGWGERLHEHWLSKQRLSAKISWSDIDSLYAQVRAEQGVTGGKVIGAGGGGFLMLFTPREDGRALEAFMAERGMPRLRYGVDEGGARVLAG